MRSNLFFILIFMGLFTTSFAQGNKELVFNVSKQKTDVKVFPEYDYLMHEAPHKISVTAKDKELDLKLKLAGGSVLVRDVDTVLVAENLNGNGVLLKIYDVSTGNEKLLLTKKYDVISRPELYINNQKIGVKEIAVIDTSFLSKELELRAKYKSSFIDFELKSFSFGMVCKGDYVSYRINGNQLHNKAIDRTKSCYKPDMKVYFERLEFEFTLGETQQAQNGFVKLK